MDLKQHYNTMFLEALNNIEADRYVIDNLIDDPNDSRLGVTLLIRPSEEIKLKIAAFLNCVKVLEPDQYYYPISDMHITVMSVISCYSGFHISKIDEMEYIKVINSCLNNISSFTIRFIGVTASSSCVMIQGFLDSGVLEEIRERLRTAFKVSGLQQSIDKRYAIQTAHATVIRFKNKLENKTELIREIKAYRDFEFGEFKVSQLEFVYNDWYQRHNRVRLLHRFNL